MTMPFKGTYAAIADMLAKGIPPEPYAWAIANGQVFTWDGQDTTLPDGTNTFGMSATNTPGNVSAQGRWSRDPALIGVAQAGANGTILLQPLNNGQSDKSRIQAALNLAAAVVFAAGSFMIDGAIAVPDGAVMSANPQTNFVGKIASALVADSMFVATNPTAVGAATTLNGGITQGSNTMVVTSAANAAVGRYVAITNAVSSIIEYYRVDVVNGTTITTDRPILWPFNNGDAVQFLANPPPRIYFHGNGCTMSGQAPLWFYGAFWNSIIEDINFANMIGNNVDACAGWQSGSYNCVMRHISIDGTGVGTMYNAGLGHIAAEQCTIEDIAISQQGGSTNCTGVKVDDSRNCTVRRGVISNLAFGVVLGSDFAVTTNATVGCTVDEVDCSKNGYGVFIGAGSSSNSISNVVANDCTTDGIAVAGTGSTNDNNIYACTCKRAGRFNMSIAAGAKLTKVSMCTWQDGALLDLLCTDGAQIVDCSSSSIGGTQPNMQFAGVNTDPVLIRNCTIISGNGSQSAILNSSSTLEMSGSTISLGSNNSVGLRCDAGAIARISDTLITATGGATGTTAVWANGAGAKIQVESGCDLDGRAALIAFVAGTVSMAQVNGLTSKAITTGTTALTQKESTANCLETTGLLTANGRIDVPANIPGLLYSLFNNNTGAFTATFGVAGGAGIAVAQGKRAMGYADGAGNFVRVSPDT